MCFINNSKQLAKYRKLKNLVFYQKEIQHWVDTEQHEHQEALTQMKEELAALIA